MDIKDEIVLNGISWATVYEIEYNIIGAFKTSNSSTPGYYIVQRTGNAYNLQEQYICRIFDPPVIIPKGELVCQDRFMTPIRKLPIGITSQMKQYLSW